VVKHLVGGFGPHKRFAAFVPAGDERGDCLFEAGGAGEGTPSDGLAGDDPEGDLD
jgi:hypothetical protein